ncbi:hypothetical protein QAD02_008182 [Eretmocerus hayati]|uniref:Uncharacterized protein n=1 Tax=Eretmocerus hayati TaxID=131215 RepID=A0ACC2N5P8_9HYME|nr:hypothetical protein QAD02_008182 [Eretmocerus hayati]
MSYRTVSVGITRLGPEELEAIARPPYIDAFILIFDERIATSPSSHPAASVSSNQSPARSEVSSFCLSSPARSEASVICLETLAGSEVQSVIESPARSDTESVICLGSPACSDSSSVVCIGSPSPLRPGIDTPFSPSNSNSEPRYTPLSEDDESHVVFSEFMKMRANINNHDAFGGDASNLIENLADVDELIDKDVANWFDQNQPIFPGLDFSVPDLMSPLLPSPPAPSQYNNNNNILIADEEFNQALHNVQEENNVELDQRYSNMSNSSSPQPPPVAPSEGDDNLSTANEAENNDNGVMNHDQENANVQFEIQAEIHQQQEQSGTIENSTVEVQAGTYANSTNDVYLVEPPELLYINGYYYQRISRPITVQPPVSRGKPWAQLVLERNKELLAAEKKEKRVKLSKEELKRRDAERKKRKRQLEKKEREAQKANIAENESGEQNDKGAKKSRVEEEEMTHQQQQPHAQHTHQQQLHVQQQSHAQQQQPRAKQQSHSQQQQPRTKQQRPCAPQQQSHVQQQPHAQQQQRKRQPSSIDPNYRIPKLKLKLQKNMSGEKNYIPSSVNFDELANSSASGEFKISSVSNSGDHALDDLSDTDLSKMEFAELIKINRKKSR